MLDRYRTRYRTGLRVMFDGFGILGCAVLAAVMAVFVVVLAAQFGLLVGGLVAAAVLLFWPPQFAGLVEPDRDETEFGASFDAMEPRDREILRGIRERACEYERLSKARDLWNLMRRPGDRSRPSVEL